jgi:hypothetical protein
MEQRTVRSRMWLGWALLIGFVLTITYLIQSALAANAGDVGPTLPDPVEQCRKLWSGHVDVGADDTCGFGTSHDGSTPVAPVNCWHQAEDALLNGDDVLGRWLQEACAGLPAGAPG